MESLVKQRELCELELRPFKDTFGCINKELSPAEDRMVKSILRSIEKLENEIKMREITKPYYELLAEGIKYIRKEDSIKTFRQARNLLKKELAEFAEEKEEEIWADRDRIWVYNKKSIWLPYKLEILLWEDLDEFFMDASVFKKNNVDFDYSIPFKQYRAILFLVSWLFKSPTEENISLLRETVKRMKNEFYVNQKIDEMNTNLLENSLVMLAKKHGIKYQIEKENTFCTVTFRLRPYYKLKVRLLYSELSQQLSDLNSVLEKSIEISASSLVPQISVNRSYVWLSK